MNSNDLVNYLADIFPYKKKSSLDWMAAASVGLGLGITLGIGLGVLLAPTSGERTRQRLRDTAERVKERAINATQKAQAQLQEAAGTGTAAGERSFTDDLGAR
jgi:hypothetical protein